MFTCLNILLYFVCICLLRCRRVKSHLAFILSQKYIQYNRYMYRHSIYRRVQYTHRKFTLNKVLSSYICFTSILIRSDHVSQSFYVLGVHVYMKVRTIYHITITGSVRSVPFILGEQKRLGVYKVEIYRIIECHRPDES